MKAIPVLLLLLIACDVGITPPAEETITIDRVDGVDAISAQLTFSATGNPDVTVIVSTADDCERTFHPLRSDKSCHSTVGVIEFSPAGPAAKSIVLVAQWPGKRIEIPVKGQ